MNDDIVAALRACLPYLSRARRKKRSRYICIAMSLAFANGKITSDQMTQGQQYILNLIDPCMYLEDWLVRHGYIPKQRTRADRVQIQQYRHRWVQHLIEELS